MATNAKLEDHGDRGPLSSNSFSVEIATASSGVVVISLPNKPANVLQLKEHIGIDKQKTAQLVFTGGKKLRDADPVPFDASGRVKCRLFGGSIPSVLSTASSPDETSKHPKVAEPKLVAEDMRHPSDENSISSPSVPLTTTTTDLGETYVVVKGLSSNHAQEFKTPVFPDMTYLELKRVFVEQGNCAVSDVRGVRFLGKGGKPPLDSDLVPSAGVTTLRAMRSDRGHDEIESKLEVVEIERRVDSAEKTVPMVLNRLFDAESCTLHSRRIREEMEDAIRWLDGRRADLEKRAQAVIDRLSNSSSRNC